MLTSNTVNADTTSCRRRFAWATAMCSLCCLALLLPGVAQADEQPSPNVVAPSAASVATVSQDLDQAVELRTRRLPPRPSHPMARAVKSS
jgi:hypothetical protein